MMPQKVSRKFTGWHMTGILVAFFGTVMAVNFTMAGFALSTFGGIQVENSYVASQNFNQWLDAAAEQEKLGWDVTLEQAPEGRLRVLAEGPGENATVLAHARHPVGRKADITLTFTPQPDGSFLSDEALEHDRWIVRLELADGDKVWKREDRL
ncbi:hypothetical protein D2V17_05910 [Aurantiacibacter xanthus]|uniref:Nitrogen fixation protein FixH n=2 Tax=Aurantiacibacter xanthus TaxID=1784712 RepID=A0A3A1P723_9SPHN|nr:hypothetical protein D2V17_05910 [Aurantiacibacter xanthus]